jgi:hypothetical protein
VHDVGGLGWLSVRKEVEPNHCSELEPLPVASGNLAVWCWPKPSGPPDTVAADAGLSTAVRPWFLTVSEMDAGQVSGAASSSQAMAGGGLGR